MKKFYTGRLVSMALVCVMATGCASQKVRLQFSENLYVAERQTKLVAGLRKVDDIRPEKEKSTDEANDRPRDVVVGEQIYKNFRLSGLFQNVLFDRFKEDQVDVVITPRLKGFTSFDVPNEKTAAALGIALIPLVNIVYAAAGGPISDHTATIDVVLELKKGASVQTISVARSLSVTKRLGGDQISVIGKLEADVLSDAVRELIEKAALALD